MSVEDNKRIVGELIQAMQAADGARLDALLAADFVWIHPLDPAYSSQSGTYDRAHFLQLTSGFSDLMPGGIRLEVKGMTAEGERVAVEAESFGQSVVGPYNNRYHFLFVVRNGKVAVGKEYADSAYMQAFAEKARAHMGQQAQASH